MASTLYLCVVSVYIGGLACRRTYMRVTPVRCSSRNINRSTMNRSAVVLPVKIPFAVSSSLRAWCLRVPVGTSTIIGPTKAQRLHPKRPLLSLRHQLQRPMRPLPHPRHLRLLLHQPHQPRQHHLRLHRRRMPDGSIYRVRACGHRSHLS
jgi:hypothetical protein